jgi:hypothetical protein
MKESGRKNKCKKISVRLLNSILEGISALNMREKSKR